MLVIADTGRSRGCSWVMGGAKIKVTENYFDPSGNRQVYLVIQNTGRKSGVSSEAGHV